MIPPWKGDEVTSSFPVTQGYRLLKFFGHVYQQRLSKIVLARHTNDGTSYSIGRKVAMPTAETNSLRPLVKGGSGRRTEAAAEGYRG